MMPNPKKWYRARDILARGTFGSHMTLWRAIRRGGFPPGRLISPNARAWTVDELEAYEATRPTAAKVEEAV